MTTYKIEYQVRRHSAVSIPQGDWLDEQMVVLVDDDAREAVDEVSRGLTNHDFRLKRVILIGNVDIISGKILSRTNP